MGQHAEDLMFHEQKMFGFNRFCDFNDNYIDTKTRKHETKDGKVLLIDEMTDSHLINTIKFKLKNIKNKTNSYEFHTKRMPLYLIEAKKRNLNINDLKDEYIYLLSEFF